MSLGAFVRTRYGAGWRTRAALEAHQRAGFACFRAKVMPRSPFYAAYADRPLQDLPPMNKARLMESFSRINTCGIAYDEALHVALKAEHSRDFSPTIGDVSVGLSTGTSGQRGLFLATSKERRLWAAILMGRFGPNLMQRQRVAFFMRADNALYRTLSNPLVRFEFFDMLSPFEAHLRRLNDLTPTVVIAPASMMRHLAQAQSEGTIEIAPHKIISVAETLCPDDKALAEAAFGCRLDEVYQATEGVLAFTCPAGSLHLNEGWLQIDRDVIDPDTGAFCPIIHDFTRESLPILNYRLNDVLLPEPAPCACGSACVRIARIEGREDDMLWWQGVNGRKIVPAEAIRSAIAAMRASVRDYSIIEKQGVLTVWLDHPTEGATAEVAHALQKLAQRLEVSLPVLDIRVGCPPRTEFKHRRIRVERQ
ncbi:adenylate synthase [Epibacterium sp. DP7N7-1]|nr:adenylate synthase [Epibacterium sp. DP7N7-1]